MQSDGAAAGTPDAARAWFHAYQETGAELAAFIDGIVVTSVVFAPAGDLVVLFNRPDESRYAWIYDPQHLPSSEAERAEYARLSLLGDLAPPARWVQNLGRKDLVPWVAQFGDVLWGGRTGKPRGPAR